MKKACIIVCLLMGFTLTYAQRDYALHEVNSFFNEYGIARIETKDYSPTRDTIVTTFHRMDDILWARVVYRIIDMRYKQNYQLYFPTRSDDPTYHSLFQVITNAVIDGMPVFQVNADMIKPDFSEPLNKRLIPGIFMADDPLADYSDDPSHYDITSSDAMLVHYDSITDELSFHAYAYDDFVRNQLKYIIQEVVFFSRNTSRLHTKIMAIAPMHSDHISTRDSSDVLASVRESMLFWIRFDDLRPYMLMQYVIPSMNETKRVTYEEFFQKRLYTSYIVGDGNMYNRMISEYAVKEEDVKKEQKRIEAELLNFEQDLWEY